MIVFADADRENAVSEAQLANFYTQGEICTNGARVFVERKLLGAFLDRLVERTRLLRIGDPLRPETEIGALISAAHRDRVLSYIEACKQAEEPLLDQRRVIVRARLVAGEFRLSPSLAQRA